MSIKRSYFCLLNEVATPSNEKVSGIKDDKLPYIGLEHMETEAPTLIGKADSSYSSSTNGVFHPGDVLFGKLRPYLRKCVGVDFSGYCSTDIIVLRPKDGVDPSFAAKVFQSDKVFREAARTSFGTKMPRTSWPQLSQLRVFLPSPKEQRRIAQILDTLDETIRRTEQVIAKLQRMKQGLLHDLLTRGLDDKGELRDAERHPEQFKDSVLGLIPKKWVVQSLGNAGTWLSGGTPAKSNPKYWDGHVPWVTPKDMKVFDIALTHDRLTHEGSLSGSNLAPSGSVFVVVRGMILAHTFPVCLSGQQMAFNQDIKAVVPDSGVSGRFLAYVFLGHSNEILGLVTESSHGTKKIDLPILQRHLFACPEPHEQLQIVSRLVQAEARIRSEILEKEKMVLLKSGLLDDLLTGRVRIPQAEALPEPAM